MKINEAGDFEKSNHLAPNKDLEKNLEVNKILPTDTEE